MGPPPMNSHATLYLGYVLSALVLIYLMNQLDRYLLTVLTTFMAPDIHYGNQICLANSNTSVDESLTRDVDCSAAINETQCNSIQVLGESVCTYKWNGAGSQYDLLVGPVFVVAYTVAGIFL